MIGNDLQPRILPFPVESQQKKKIQNLKTVLHNAGSFGGDFRKGTPEAIQIFQQSNLAQQGVRLLITALKQPAKELVELVAKKPANIEWSIGVKDSWQEIYQEADLLLYPSRIEGHALPVLEAHSFGIPALCTNFPPINEYESDLDFLLPSHSTDGFRVKVDIEASAKILSEITDVQIENKSKEVFDSVRNFYTWEILGPIYDQVLK